MGPKSAALVVTGCFLLGCANRTTTPAPTTAPSPSPTQPISNNTADDAVRTANLSAQRRGIDLLHFHEPEAWYDTDRRVWHVFYRGKPFGAEQVPLGHHFMINVHENGLTELVPGK